MTACSFASHHRWLSPLVLLLSLSFHLANAAESPSVTQGPAPQPIASTPSPFASTADGEPRLTLSYSLAPLSVGVPLKHGPAISWKLDDNWTIEFNCLKGHIGLGADPVDIGSFTETLISLQGRYFTNKKFNWIIGFSEQTYDVLLANDFISRLGSSGYPGDIANVKVRTFGVQAGFGHRWKWESGFTLGVDWLVLNIPIQTREADAPFLDYVTNPSDRDQVDDALKTMRRLPTAAAFKIMLGYTF